MEEDGAITVPLTAVTPASAALTRERRVAYLRPALGALLWGGSFLVLGTRHAPVHAWAALVLFLGIAAGLALIARAATAASVARALAGSAADCAAVSYLMVLLGEFGAPLAAIYALTCLDIGQRHGRVPLAAASLVALASFAAVWSLTGYWQAQPVASLAMLAVFLAAVLVTGLSPERSIESRDRSTPETAVARLPLPATAPVAAAGEVAVSETAPAVDTAAPYPHPRSATRCKVLVVDDNATNRIIAEAILNSAGYDTDAVDNAQTALERLVSGRYCLAVVDMHMPDMGGVALLRRYRNMCPRERVPIVMLTAKATPEAAQEAADAGAEAFLTKPVGARALIANVDKLLADSEARGLRAHEPRAAGDYGRAHAIDAAVLRELRKVCGSSAEFASLVRAFQEEGAELLRRFAQAVRAHDLKSATDSALALRASAVNFGAQVLAGRCEWASQVSDADLRSMGQQLIDEVTHHFDVVMQELEAIVAQDRKPDGVPPPAASA